MSILTINKMFYCPKCQQSYEDAAQRFCLNDGARLLPAQNSPDSADGAGGVFTSFLGKPASNEKLEDKFASMPRFAALEPLPTPNNFDSPPENRFFGDDDEIELELETKERETIKPSARSVKPDEVPSGTAEVGDRKTNPVNRTALSRAQPRVLIGQAVKGRYEIVELLGEDETSLAYLAEDRLAERKKVLVRVLTGDESDLNGGIYAEEIVSLSHVNHPNIQRVIDSGELVEGNTFVVSEYAQADSIRDLMKKAKQFNAHRAARIVRQAAGALSEAHQNGILHRNLKPESVLLTVNEAGAEQVKLTNFGTSGGGSHRANFVYRAPEILAGKPATFAGDIYSLAVIAYQMLTGRLPFSAETPRDLLKAQRGDLSDLPTDLRHDLPASVDRILAKALASEPTARYPKARDFGDAFYNALFDSAESKAEIDAPEKTDSAAAANESTIPKPATFFLDDTRNAEIGNSGDEAKIEGAKTEFAGAEIIEIENRGEENGETEGIESEISETKTNDDLWTRRSPEPPKTNNFNLTLLSLVGLLVLLSAILGVWFYSLRQQTETDSASSAAAPLPQNAQPESANIAPVAVAEPSPVSTLGDIETPPPPRNVAQPPDTVYFQNSRQSSKGDLVRNFLGFSLYYPQNWQLNEATESRKADTRGKFLDISKTTDGKLSEQMLVSYYDSRGTFKEDAARFPQLVRETNETLKTLIPNYQILSEGETVINGGWRAYEVKFQGGGVVDDEKMIVWGRRLFIPAARQGARSGYEITMLATSLAPDVRSVDDVGTKGELATILQTFEPDGNF